MLRPAKLGASPALAINERRIADRTDITRPCKLQRRGASPFDSASTINLSTSGALLEIRTARPPAVGEQLAVAVAWTSSPVINSDSLVPARVIRSTPIDANRARVAVEFLRSHALILAA